MQLIIVCETRSSCKSDYKYIKGALDFYYKERTFSIKKIFATSKSELIKQDKKINKEIASYTGESKVVIFADTDNYDDELNNKIINYVHKHQYDLVWMRSDIEEVFLGRKVEQRNKETEANNFLIQKEKILSNLDNLDILDPMTKAKSSNFLVILDKYLERK